MVKYILTILLLVNLSALGKGQNHKTGDRPLQQQDTTRERVYVQTDRSVYAMPDTLWFKASLVKVEDNTPSEISGLIYVQLVNSQGDAVQTLCLPTVQGLAWSGFDLGNWKYRPGKYMLLAYTNWMRNFDVGCFFKKEITILDIKDKEEASADTAVSVAAASKGIGQVRKQKMPEADIQFLPEGGTWVTGKIQAMAIKAVGQDGKGLPVSGQVLDSRKLQIAAFRSNSKGMGVFTMTPQDGESYTVQITTTTGRYDKQLPKTVTEGTALRVRHIFHSDSITIHVYSELKNQTLTLSGQCRGRPVFITHIPAGKRERELKVAKNIFPTGVCHVQLQGANGKVLNERAFFINKYDALQIGVKAGKPFYGTRDSVSLHLSLRNVLGQTTSGSFAMAVTDDGQIAKDSLNEPNILTYLLLSSDLKGTIEDPAYYFAADNETTYNDLDALMLTQGWVSYKWDRAKPLPFKPEKEFTISDKVTNLFNKPLAGAQLNLMSFRKGLVLLGAKTNEQGEFTFRDFPVLDSAAFLLKAMNAKGKTGTLGINLVPFGNLNTFPVLKQSLVSAPPPVEDTISKKLIAARQEEYRMPAGSGKMLKVVNITGKKIVRGSKNLNGPGNADIVLNEEDMAKVPKKTLLALIKEKAERFYISTPPHSTKAYYFFNNKLLSVRIDGANINVLYPGAGWNYIDFVNYILESYTAEDIKGIEIMTSWKYSHEVAYIEVTTKGGAGPFIPNQANTISFRPPNYGNNKFFYSPKYTAGNKSSPLPDIRSTIYWNPNIMPDEHGNATVSFFSADKKGSYTVWIEGGDLQGGLGMKAFKLDIK